MKDACRQCDVLITRCYPVTRIFRFSDISKLLYCRHFRVNIKLLNVEVREFDEKENLK